MMRRLSCLTFCLTFAAIVALVAMTTTAFAEDQENANAIVQNDAQEMVAVPETTAPKDVSGLVASETPTMAVSTAGLNRSAGIANIAVVRNNIATPTPAHNGVETEVARLKSPIVVINGSVA
jgi:hypothetical protein